MPLIRKEEVLSQLPEAYILYRQFLINNGLFSEKEAQVVIEDMQQRVEQESKTLIPAWQFVVFINDLMR